MLSRPSLHRVQQSIYGLRYFRVLVIAICAMVSGVQAAETVSVQVTDSTATEGPNTDIGIITIKRAAATTSPLTVYLTPSGSATKGVDYGEVPASVVIPANATSVAVYIHAIDDTLAEASETVVVTIAANAAYTVGSPNAGTVNLRDDEPTEISISASDSSAAEGGSNTGTFTISRKGRADQELTVPLLCTGTARPGSDYQRLDEVAYLAPFAASRAMTVSPIDDTEVESDETVIAMLQPGETYLITGSSAATITIGDNEIPVVTVAASDATAAETGGNTGAFRFDRTGNKTAALTVPYTITGNATSGGDYTALSGSIVIPANALSALVTVTPIDDTNQEGPETVIVTATSGTGYVLGSTTQATVTISENEQSVSIAATDSIAFEPGTDTGKFTITRASTDLTQALTVTYSVSGSATSGSDFTALSGSVSIGANATTATVTVTPVNNTTAEPVETVIATLTPQSTYALAGLSSATVKIGDNDSTLPMVNAYAGADQQLEGTSMSFFIDRDPVSATPLTVTYVISGTATAGADYEALAGTVTFPAYSGGASINIQSLADALSENSETVTMTLISTGEYTLGSITSETRTILDAGAPVVSLTVPDTTASEPGRSSGPAQFLISRTGKLTTPLTIPLTVSGSAWSGTDYSALPAFITIPADSSSVAVPITPIDDTLVEPDETVILSLGDGAGYTLGATWSGTATIQDDEAAIVTVTASDSVAGEGGSDTGTFLISRVGRKDTALTIPLVRTGTASSGTDFTALPTSASLAANSASTTVTVTPINDALAEAPETVILTLGSGSGYTVGSPAAATVTLIDDESSVSLQVIDLYTREGGSPGAIAVSRTGSLAATLTVNLGISGSAIAGTHYQALPGTVTFPVNVSQVILPVIAIDDATWRAEAMVQVVINPGAYAIATPSSVIILTTDNDNGPPVVVVQMQTPNQSSTTLTLDASGTTDPNGDALTYRWSIYGAGVLSTTAQLAYDFKLLAGKIIELKVSDGKYSVYRYYPVLYVGTPTTIAAGDFSWDNGVLLVDATTLTVDGAHSYLVGRVINGGNITSSACTPTTTSSLQLTIEKQLFVDATSRIDVSATGLPGGYQITPLGIRPGGRPGTLRGASHGGYGGYSLYGPNDTTNEVYGSFENPTQVGSGGEYPGGNAGGGYVRLTVGALTLNGLLQANGQGTATGGNDSYGGGAGGSIHLTVGTYGGTGTIKAEGTSGEYGPGGGGRIALYYTTGTVDPTKISAAGGYMNRAAPAGNYGMAVAGTIYIKQTSQSAGTLIIDNKLGGPLLTYFNLMPTTPWYFGNRLTTTDDPSSFQVVVKTLGQASTYVDTTPTSVTWKAGSSIDRARLAVAKIVADSLTLTNDGILQSLATTATSIEKLDISVAGTLSIDATSRIDVSGLGLLNGYRWSTSGPTTVGTTTGYAGASYGGYGGLQDATYEATNEVYGIFDNPNEVGSGGGIGNSGGAPGNAGGGLLRLTTGTLTLNGSLRANGQDDTNGGNVSMMGGSGGGIYVNTGTFSGSGTIQANGSGCYYAPGGGGRIALFYTTGTVTPSKISAAGGYKDRSVPAYDYVLAGAGTVYLKQTSQSVGTLIIDNKFNAPLLTKYKTMPVTPWYFGSRSSTADDPSSFQVIVKTLGQAVAYVDATPASVTWKTGSTIDRARVVAPKIIADALTLTNQASLQSPATTTTRVEKLEVSVAGTLSIDATSMIDVSGLGLLNGYTWSASGPTTVGATTGYSGGSYGGYGGLQSATTEVTNEVYGTFDNPNEVGSGGGAGSQGSAPGNSGGGLIRLTTGTLSLQGSLRANGQDDTNGGNVSMLGGSGGGIYVSTGTFSGSGTIQAMGSPCWYAPGGGGRIAIYYTSGTIDPAKICAAGGCYNRTTFDQTYVIAGAGTAYVRKTTNTFGDLRIHNLGIQQTRPTSLFFPIKPAVQGSQPICSQDFQLLVSDGASYILEGDPYAFDADRDGLKSWEEFLAGTAPRDADSNDNGITDGIEFTTGLNPLVTDSDGDGVSNVIEIARGSDPFRADSDSDGVNDATDVFPTDPSASSWPIPSPTDTTPPVITITSPSGVVKL